jgi:hypothetical protein
MAAAFAVEGFLQRVIVERDGNVSAVYKADNPMAVQTPAGKAGHILPDVLEVCVENMGSIAMNHQTMCVDAVKAVAPDMTALFQNKHFPARLRQRLGKYSTCQPSADNKIIILHQAFPTCLRPPLFYLVYEGLIDQKYFVVNSGESKIRFRRILEIAFLKRKDLSGIVAQKS